MKIKNREIVTLTFDPSVVILDSTDESINYFSFKFFNRSNNNKCSKSYTNTFFFFFKADRRI